MDASGPGVVLSPDPSTSRWPLLAVLLAYCAIASFGFGPYLTDDHGFRQTQTALTAESIHGFRDLFSAETPVLGPPWGVPFEFPLYQGAAKALSALGGVRLATAGRLVGMVSMMLCLWPLLRIGRLLQVKQPAIVIAPVFLAPVYVFWSRAFLIETTALLFALVYFSQLLEILITGRWSLLRFVALASSGLLAALVKATTALPLVVVGLAASVWLAFVWLRRGGSAGLWIGLVLAHVALAVPAVLWLNHADGVKAGHPLASALTSRALTAWNYGPLSQRFEPLTWFRLANNSADMIAPFPRSLAMVKALLLLGWLAAFGYFLRACSVRRRRQVLISAALFVAPFLIFTNLHRVHNYYQAGNGVFLLAAFGLAAYGAFEEQPVANRQTVKAVFFATLLGLGSCSLWFLSFKSSHLGESLAISQAVRTQTASDEIVIISGQEWSPVIPYQSGRKALMLAPFADDAMLAASADAIRKAGLRVGAFVACEDKPDRRVASLLKRLDVVRGPASKRMDDCVLHRLEPAARSP